MNYKFLNVSLIGSTCPLVNLIYSFGKEDPKLDNTPQQLAMRKLRRKKRSSPLPSVYNGLDYIIYNSKHLMSLYTVGA